MPSTDFNTEGNAMDETGDVQVSEDAAMRGALIEKREQAEKRAAYANLEMDMQRRIVAACTAALEQLEEKDVAPTEPEPEAADAPWTDRGTVGTQGTGWMP